MDVLNNSTVTQTAEPVKKVESKSKKEAKTSEWADVFEVHPAADEIYIAGDMPFLNQIHADNHAASIKGEVTVVKRP